MTFKMFPKNGSSNGYGRKVTSKNANVWNEKRQRQKQKQKPDTLSVRCLW